MRVPSYRRHSTRNLGFAEHGGKRKYFPGNFDSVASREAYQQFLCAIGADGSIDVGRPDAFLEVRRLVAMFMEWAAEEYGVGGDTRYDVYHAATKHLTKRYRREDARNFGPKKLKALMLDMAKQKLRRSYINAVKGHICFVFQWGVTEELIPAAQLRAMERVKGLRRGRTEAREKSRKAEITWKDIKAVFPEVSETVRLMLRFQWLVFFRSKSICRAVPEQFKCVEDDLWEWRPTHKTEHLDIEVVLFLGPRCQRLLRVILARTKKGQRLFPNYTTRSYCRAITRAIARINAEREKAGAELLPHWTPHRLRHTRGDLVRQRFGAEAAQAALAHESLTATQIYTRRSRKKARAVAAEIG